MNAGLPREILKKIRQIELRTSRLVSDRLAGEYHSVFKGQGINFDEVREYQPGDDVRSIDWNVTARMSHPFIKKFVEERELTVMLLVDVSGSGRFGSATQSKRELSAEIASLLAFSAIRNNDKVGLILFSNRVEKYVAPRKGRRHVLRVIREILFAEPEHKGTHLGAALDFLQHITRRRSITVLISDFLDTPPGANESPAPPPHPEYPESPLAPRTAMLLRQLNRRHDVVAVHILDRFELELPPLGRLVLEDSEHGEVIEVRTSDPHLRESFRQHQSNLRHDLERHLRSLNIDTIRLQTDQPYNAELERFFQTREKRRRHG